ncbi:hypothetical protein NW752_001855 [Fusarium irregulare]|uniref:Uncharacterized protein n=1 Tax=Fusarium irregulare TaxID=2494466 RepID=A0A9W8UCW5_9HYPO|nr:hypothetical protein NW766_004020 [Fusarium irregulare]KAJ4026897.1 hypothetical protein NW752_001855 [Fusarium irregulare]
MNGTQSPDPQKPSNANSNGSNSNNSSLAAKKRKKDLKPIITMEGTNQTEGYHGHDLFHSINCTAGTEAALHTQEISNRW